MKIKVEFEVEVYPHNKNDLIEFIKDWSEDKIEYELRHTIKDFNLTEDDLDEIFVKVNNIKEL